MGGRCSAPHASVAPLRGTHSRLCRVRGKGPCRKVLGCGGGGVAVHPEGLLPRHRWSPRARWSHLLGAGQGGLGEGQGQQGESSRMQNHQGAFQVLVEAAQTSVFCHGPFHPVSGCPRGTSDQRGPQEACYWGTDAPPCLPSLTSGSHPDGFSPTCNMPTNPDSPPAGSRSVPL